MANPSQTILPDSFQVAHNSLTQVFRAAVEQFNKNLLFRGDKVCRAIERFVDELYRVPGAADELLRRSSFIEQSCGPNTPYDQAKLQALESYKGRPTKRSAAGLAMDALRHSAPNPTFLGQVSEERTRLEQVLGEGAPKLSDEAVDAFEQRLSQCREIQREAERLEVDGCFYLFRVHRATPPKPPDVSKVARALIEGGGIGGAHLDSMLAAVDSLVAWVRENRENLSPVTTGPESSGDHADTKPPGREASKTTKGGEQVGQLSSSTPTGGGKSNRKASVNARMLETIQKESEALGWNSRQWSEHLKCAKSSVVATPTWKNLTMGRERKRAERALDRRRRPKASDQQRD